MLSLYVNMESRDTGHKSFAYSCLIMCCAMGVSDWRILQINELIGALQGAGLGTPPGFGGFQLRCCTLAHLRFDRELQTSFIPPSSHPVPTSLSLR